MKPSRIDWLRTIVWGLILFVGALFAACLIVLAAFLGHEIRMAL